METRNPSISPLRQRMIEDMRMRKFGEKTQLDYVRAVRQFAQYLGRSPDTASVEDLRNYQLHLVDHGTSPRSLVDGHAPSHHSDCLRADVACPETRGVLSHGARRCGSFRLVDLLFLGTVHCCSFAEACSGKQDNADRTDAQHLECTPDTDQDDEV